MNSNQSWQKQFQNAQAAENSDSSWRWMQIATITEDSKPRVRTVVFRGWNGLNKMYFLTDSRSAKVKEICDNPSVEVCYLFKQSLTQFRFRGIATIDKGRIAQRAWESLNASSKGIWSGDCPGEALKIKKKSITPIASEAEMPKNFLVILIELSEVELLIIKELPHRRMKWSADKNWQLLNINP